MKRYKLFLISLLIAFIPSMVQAIYTDPNSGIEYSIEWSNSDEYAAVYNGKNALGHVNILSSITVNGIEYKVKWIHDNAFEGCDGVTSIFLPNSIEHIGQYAFKNCINLTSINIPKNAAYSPLSAFDGCTGLISVEIHYEYVRSWFKNITNLKQVIIGDEVTTIGNSAFSGCSGLKSITIPNSVTSIEMYAFRNCTSLTSIVIPNSVTYIASFIFLGCTNLTSIEFHCNTIGPWINGMENIKNVVIGEEVTTIGPSAFEKCTGLSSITIPSNVSLINNNAFSGCTGLTSIKLPSNLIAIENAVFSSCTSLTSITLPSTLKTIGSSAFTNCTSLANIDIPDNVTTIESWAFAGCTALNTFTIPNNVNTIEDYLFYNCSKLSSCTIPNHIEKIGAYAFAGCTALNTFTIPNNVTTIEDHLFYNCSKLSSLSIPNHIETIGTYAFAGCTGLKSIALGSGISSIGTGAFENCGNNLEVTFHNKEIQNWFSKNNSLKTVLIGNEVTSIGNEAFKECEQLESITIGKNVTSIADNALINCSALAYIVIDDNNTVYDSRNNCNAIIKTATNTLEKGSSNTKIPNSVTRLNTFAFQNCKGLTSIFIPKTLNSIGGYAFAGCEHLNRVSTDFMDPSDIHLEQNHCFDGIASNSVLIVPKGRRTSFEKHFYWRNSFAQIIEDENTSTIIDFEYNGIQYHGDFYEGTAVIIGATVKGGSTLSLPSEITYKDTRYTIIGINDNAINGDVLVLDLPQTLQSISSKALSNCKTSTIIWNANIALPAGVINNSPINKDGNALLYIKKDTYNPGNMRNVVINGVADLITLSDDGGNFICPREFTANEISYTHNYTMPTIKGTCQGWETLTMPFDVQKIVHETKGEIVPFTNYDKNSNQLPFWLYELTNSGFAKANTIKANTPYIISMPNDANAYDAEYLLGGKVSFSASNATVKEANSLTVAYVGNIAFVPNFYTIPPTPGIYTLNVNNDYVQSANGLAPGSCFINNLREVRPFEAYITHSVGAREVIDIHFADDVTDIIDIASYNGKNSANTIYTLSGMKIATVSESELKQTLNALPCGIYIVDGKKLIKQ